MSPTVFDGHNDILTKLHFQPEGGRSFFERSDEGHLDLPRMIEGGFAGGLFAVMPRDEATSKGNPAFGAGDQWEIPEFPPVDHESAFTQSVEVSKYLHRLEAESGGKLEVVVNAADLRHRLQSNVVAAVLHFEGAEAIDPNLESLERFYDSGLRSLGLTWSRPNAFAHGVPFRFPHSPDTGPGLTAAGKELVAECNRIGILIDLSHLNEKGFWDVAAISEAPLVASHSNAHALCPITRNLTDDQLKAIGDSGGIVGINFSVAMLRADGQKNVSTPLSRIFEHVEYISELIGIDHVALGSDFDGTTISTDLGDVTGLPKLVSLLRHEGYGEDDIERVANRNWLRVIEATWS